MTDVLTSRRSVRKYQSKAVPEKVIGDILECARMAPTAINIQPWLLGAATDKAVLGELAEATDHGKFIAGCAVCFSVFCRKDQKYYLEDGCAATMNIITAAWAHGVGTCWVAGDKKAYCEKVRGILNVPEGFTLVALIPAGYPGERPARPKKQISEVSFRDRM